jgi:hypothetical protein
MTGLVLLIVFAAIVGCGSAYSAFRNPVAITLIKIVVACVLLLFSLVALAGMRWITGEEDLSGVTLVVRPVAAIAITACLCSVMGMLLGTYRRRNRSSRIS